MTIKFKGFDWDIIITGIILTAILYCFIFAISGLCYNMGLNNYYRQTFMSNYTTYDLPVGIDAFYEAEAWVNSLILGALLSLWISIGIFALFVICFIVSGFESK